MGTAIRWVIVLGLLGWGGAMATDAGRAYFATEAMVDKVLRETFPRHRAAFATGAQGAYESLAVDVRRSVLRAARADGLPVKDSDLSVSVSSSGVVVTVRWSEPLINYGGHELLAVPISARGSLLASPP
jgi:hypothetical protein